MKDPTSSAKMVSEHEFRAKLKNTPRSRCGSAVHQDWTRGCAHQAHIRPFLFGILVVSISRPTTKSQDLRIRVSDAGRDEPSSLREDDQLGIIVGIVVARRKLERAISQIGANLIFLTQRPRSLPCSHT